VAKHDACVHEYGDGQTSMDSLKGQLLLAGAGLHDPNFHRTVVLIAEHSDEGALGLVLNRPADVSVGEAAPPLGSLVEPDEPVFVGGPVDPQALIVLAEFEEPEDAASLVLGNIGFLPAETDAEPETLRARVFAGYSGWSAGQLEAELEEDAWILEPARPDDVFAAAGADVWGDVLRRKGGQFSVLALMPPDLSLN
jgi:putative transcriptional regulator